MARQKKPKGIRRLPSGKWQVFVRRNRVFKSKNFDADYTIEKLKLEREKLIGRMVDPDAFPPELGGKTFADDCDEYLDLVTGMASYADRDYRIRQWKDLFGARSRSTITPREIASALEQWRRNGASNGGPLSPASLNQRRTALMHLWTRLDGKSAANPVRDVPPYDERDSEIIRAVPMLVMARLIRHLRAWGKMRALLHVLMWTGWPHALLKGVKPEDIDWDRSRVRLGRRKKGKGMPAAWVPVLPRGMLALRRMDRLKAWGTFSNSSLHSAVARAVRNENVIRELKGLPQLPAIRVYDFKHGFATWAAGIIKDDRALKELLRTNQIARYTEGATAARLEAATAALKAAAHPRASNRNNF